MSVDAKWIVNLQGRDYVQFPGLLDLAHRSGLRSIETELVQMPTSENGEFAVVRAIGRFQGEDGDAVWSAYGDASPQNVNRMIRTALLRMAETRAIGRMLRMATNVGVTMFEELPGGEHEEAPTNHGHRGNANGKPASVSSPSKTSRTPPASSAESITCQYPHCRETTRSGDREICRVKNYGANYCQDHILVQDEPALSKSGKPIHCKVDGCGAALTNNEVLQSSAQFREVLCLPHRIERMERIDGPVVEEAAPSPA